MIELTLKEVAAACDGTLENADPDAVVGSVAIDSRAAAPGAIFVAFVGEHADGLDFVGDALARGAVAGLGTRPVGDHPMVVVPDVLAALTSMAHLVRDRLTATVVGITGSAGKTSTKDLTAAALESKRVVASEANHNNEIGVPMTITRAGPDTEVLVVEVGARGAGHIASLMPLVRPQIGVVTNVGSAHAGLFGTLEQTALEKGALIEALSPDGTAVLNADDPLVAAMGARTGARLLTFGRGGAADVRASGVRLDADGRPTFTAHTAAGDVEVALRMAGEHMVDNALAALAVAHVIGVDLAAAATGLAACEPTRWRMQVEARGERRIINDAYNASPESVAAALKTLVTMGRGRPTWAVLGAMAELGDRSVEAHDRIGRLAVRLGVDNLVVVGADARPTFEAARGEGMFGGEARFADDVGAALELLRAELEPDAVVLVKASRAAGLERIAEGLA